jgi:putative ABC transport system permease protein
LTREEVREGWRGLIRRVYGVAYTQEVIVGVVAVLGVVAALLISVLGRRRELGLLRAVGGTRPQLLQTVLAEAVLIGLVGTLLGIVVGLPMEWYAVRVVLFEETGFLFPMRVAWQEAGVIAALSILSATLAGVAPAVQAMRLRIADAIAYE